MSTFNELLSSDFELGEDDFELDEDDFELDEDYFEDEEDENYLEEESEPDDIDFDFLEDDDTIDGGTLNLDGEEEHLYSDESDDTDKDTTDYSDETVVQVEELLEDEDENIQSNNESGFISDSGNIVVQDTSDDRGNGFELVYLDIDRIAITHRVRKMESVEGLVQSIKSTGLLKPVVVAPTATEGLFVLLDGFRRIQACVRAGKTKIPCVVNNRVNTPEIPILEALYNHRKSYSIREQIEYIDYLEKQKGIMNPAMIEYLLQMNSGDYTKLKDILNDNDDDIVSKLYEGVYDIPTAFKKLEQRRRKESAEEKENKKAAKVYGNEEESGVNQIEGTGEEANGEALTEEQIRALCISAENLDDGIEDSSINEMVEADNSIEGFKPHKQKSGEREFVDPIIKKTVMTRDKSTCQCCKRGGEQYVDILDYHHILPVFLGGEDTPENGMMLCVSCHRLVHLYSTADLHIDKALLTGIYSELNDEQKKQYENAEIFEDEKKRFKRVIKLGSVIRKGIAARGMNREQYKKEHSNNGIGRRRPGVNAEQSKL